MPPDPKLEVDISVIIPAYQAERSIERAIRSAAHQTYQPCEIIVCDDGSHDKTLDVIKALEDAVNGVPIKVLMQSNKGAGAARNHAIRKAASRWIAFLDADDEWLPEKLEHSVAEIQKSDLILVAHSFTQIAPDGDETLIDCKRRFSESDDPLRALYRYGFIATSTVVVRKSAVTDCGGFDETLAAAQDFDLWLKVLSQKGARFAVFAAPLMRYTVSDGGITSHTMRRLDCTLRVAKDHQKSYADLVFRIIAIHYEALNAYRRGKMPLKMAWVLMLLAARLIGSPLMMAHTETNNGDLPNWLVWLFWLWVLGAFGAYLYRFRHLVEAFYKLVLSL